MSTIRLGSSSLLPLLMLVGTVANAAEPMPPMQLHTVLRSETFHCMVGDLLQVRYQTRATDNAIGTFRVSGTGDVVKQIAVVTAPIDPTDESSQPGAPYHVIVIFKAVKQGEVNIKVTPVLIDGTYGRPFHFAVEAQK